MLAEAPHDLNTERDRNCGCNVQRPLPGSFNAAPGPSFHRVSSEWDCHGEDMPFRATLRTVLSDRNVGSAEFLNSFLVLICGGDGNQQHARGQWGQRGLHAWQIAQDQVPGGQRVGGVVKGQMSEQGGASGGLAVGIEDDSSLELRIAKKS